MRLLLQLPKQILTYFPKEGIVLKPREQTLIKVEAPFPPFNLWTSLCNTV